MVKLLVDLVDFGFVCRALSYDGEVSWSYLLTAVAVPLLVGRDDENPKVLGGERRREVEAQSPLARSLCFLLRFVNRRTTALATTHMVVVVDRRPEPLAEGIAFSLLDGL